MQQAIKGVLAAFMIAGASGSAWAVPATVEADLNIRSGPSTGYAVLDTMPGGAIVDVVACYSGWCEVVWDGLGGFASRAYLDIYPGVTVVPPPAGAIVAPGIVVYESRYFERPIWTSRGHIIRQAIRRDIRRDRREARQERREDRREIRRDRREDRREVRQERRERAEPARGVQRQIRRTREDRADALRERQRRIENSRRSVERRSSAGPRARVQEQRQQRREVRQERRNDAGQARQQRREVRQERRKERRETTGSR